MKKLRIQPFLYRAFHSSGFRLSFVLGLFLAVLQIVQMRTPIDCGYVYPASLYAMWVGGEWASYASSLLFLLLPLIATLPFSDCVARDKKTGYIYHLLLHQERSTVFLECALTAFISGFSAAILPFLENFLLCATLYPALPPQASTYTFSPSLHGFLVNVFCAPLAVLPCIYSADRRFLWRPCCIGYVPRLFYKIPDFCTFTGICAVLLGLLHHNATGVVFPEPVCISQPNADRGFPDDGVSRLCHRNVCHGSLDYFCRRASL